MIVFPSENGENQNQNQMNDAFELIEALANNGNKIEAFNELEDIYDSMSRKNRTEIARKIIELSFRHSALIDICVRNGKGKLGNYLWFLLFL